MKKTAILLLVCLAVSLCGCGNSSKSVKETDDLILDGLIVDDTYRDKDNSPRRAVYAFFTLNSKSENIKFDSKLDIIIGEANTYTAEILPHSLCEYAPNYYYGGYLETAYVGESKKLAATFLIPEGDLESGKQVTFSDSDIESMSKLILSTDDIVHVNGDDEACKSVDPEGYEEIKQKFEEASAETSALVQSLINDRYWEAYVNPSSYRVEFSYPRNFSVITQFGENGGTYSVRNGYIFCTYSSNGATIKIPYEIKDEGVTMDLGEAFRIN